MDFFSSDENEAVKTSDTTGNIHNSIVQQDNSILELLLIIITIIKVLELMLYCYTNYVRRLRKRYNTNTGGAA